MRGAGHQRGCAAIACDGGWTDKLHHLLYEEGIIERDAPRFAGLEGVMLQSNRPAYGRSANQFIARLQQAAAAASSQPDAADLLERPRRPLPLVSEEHKTVAAGHATH
ncbi:hypothetical protein WMF38_38735 [Sorangium sp. So ce118]